MTTRHDPAALAAEWAEHADLNLREARHSRTQAQTRANGLDSEEEAQQSERWKRRAEQSTAKAKEARLMALMWAAVATAQAPIDALPAACTSASWHDEDGVHRCKGGHSPEAKHSDGVHSWDAVEITPPSKPMVMHRRSAPDVLRFHADVLAQISRGAATFEAFTSITAVRVGLSVLADQLSTDLEPTAVDANNPCPCGCIDPECPGCQAPGHQQLYAKN